MKDVWTELREREREREVGLFVCLKIEKQNKRMSTKMNERGREREKQRNKMDCVVPKEEKIKQIMENKTKFKKKQTLRMLFFSKDISQYSMLDSAIELKPY